jgi:hypothetical protein
MQVLTMIRSSCARRFPPNYKRQEGVRAGAFWSLVFGQGGQICTGAGL